MIQHDFHFRANGKLLLTGEYVVMDGAAAIALPLKFGQSLSVTENKEEDICWTASDTTGIWFEGTFETESFNVLNSSDMDVANKLKEILVAAESLLKNSTRPYLKKGGSLKVTTYLDYNRMLGFGSSSTLISLVADLFNVDQYKLHSAVSTGSGYDVVSAKSNSPFIYRRLTENEGTAAPFNISYPFIDSLYIIWFGRKQSTDSEIRRYRSGNIKELTTIIKRISDISLELIEVKELSTFAELIREHEILISKIVKGRPVKKSLFNDFRGEVKSLGAWGGDCLLVCTELDSKYVYDYFTSRMYNTVYCFKDIVLNNKVENHDEISIRF